MDYYVNPQLLSSAFTVPSVVVDRYFKLTKAEHIKILLYILRNMAGNLTNKEIAVSCGVDEFEVKEALLFWADAEVLLPKEVVPATNDKKSSRKIIAKNEKPSKDDAVKRGLEDSKVQFLLTQAQLKLSRNLKGNEISSFVWLYDDQGLDVSVILLIIQYAVVKGKVNIRFIESIAMDFIEKGIDNITDADAELHKLDLGETAWAVVCSAFGIERRKPSLKEIENAVKWVDEWKISKDMLAAAYDECVNSKSKFSFPYVAKIIENWHNNGYKTVDDIDKKAPSNKEGGDFVSYDIDLYEKMINSKD